MADKDHLLKVSPEYTKTIGATKENARKIVLRLVSQHWWFQHLHDHHTGRCLITFSQGIDVEKDIRAKIKGVEFEVTK